MFKFFQQVANALKLYPVGQGQKKQDKRNSRISHSSIFDAKKVKKSGSSSSDTSNTSFEHIKADTLDIKVLVQLAEKVINDADTWLELESKGRDNPVFQNTISENEVAINIESYEFAELKSIHEAIVKLQMKSWEDTNGNERQQIQDLVVLLNAFVEKNESYSKKLPSQFLDNLAEFAKNESLQCN